MAVFMADTVNIKTVVIEPEMLDIIAELERVQRCLARAEHAGPGAIVRLTARGDDRKHRVVDAHRGQQAVGSGRREDALQRRARSFGTRDEQEARAESDGWGWRPCAAQSMCEEEWCHPWARRGRSSGSRCFRLRDDHSDCWSCFPDECEFGLWSSVVNTVFQISWCVS